jgi:aspartate aminotransferase
VLPEIQEYTIYTDGASKNYGGTGLRLGWGVLPASLMQAMSHIITHMGAWAPKAVQLALAEYLYDTEDQAAYFAELQDKFRSRLQRLYDTVMQMKAEGLPVDAIAPQGGIFLSVYFGLEGCATPEGKVLSDQEAVRSYLLQQGKCAFVPFSAFGDTANKGWFRASLSGILEEDLQFSLGTLGDSLRMLQPAPSLAD